MMPLHTAYRIAMRSVTDFFFYQKKTYFSYRIEHALDDYEDNLISGRRCIACARIISAIDIHRRAIMLVFSNDIIQNLIVIRVFH